VLNSGMQNFSHLVQGEHFQIVGLTKKGQKFNEKLAIYLKQWEIRLRLVLIQFRKWHIGFQMTWPWLWKSVLRQKLYRLYSAFSLARRFYCEKIVKPASNIRVGYLRLQLFVSPGETTSCHRARRVLY